MEIIDHVASAVEERMNNNDTLSFDQALQETHQSFGLFGFSSIEEGITRGLEKKYRKLFFRFMLSFFRLKYLPVTLVAFAALYKLQDFVQKTKLMLPIFIIAVLAITVAFSAQYFRSNSLKNYLAFRCSAVYLCLLGSFLSMSSVLSMVLDTPHFYFGINLNALATAAMIGLFYIYIFSAIKTARAGAVESKLLMEKYNLVIAS
ncbi:hypothetical protein [Pedobacter endophyticus]|uniref:Uncharacterized protein n=1 Tax=Pedobacter endophyticus TaxID=2789740 RepID=A0A7S9PYT8_9SPHI|nr:hypothetical protein [Pedobacter endophyticus]QPH39215.1 hypothetical protein IZT61_19525 [Pedobacter endophyticus]